MSDFRKLIRSATKSLPTDDPNDKRVQELYGLYTDMLPLLEQTVQIPVSVALWAEHIKSVDASLKKHKDVDKDIQQLWDELVGPEYRKFWEELLNSQKKRTVMTEKGTTCFLTFAEAQCALDDICKRQGYPIHKDFLDDLMPNRDPWTVRFEDIENAWLQVAEAVWKGSELDETSRVLEAKLFDPKESLNIAEGPEAASLIVESLTATALKAKNEVLGITKHL